MGRYCRFSRKSWAPKADAKTGKALWNSWPDGNRANVRRKNAILRERRNRLLLFIRGSMPFARFAMCLAQPKIGRASCRGKSVDLGGRRIIKKKKGKDIGTPHV